MHQLISKKPIMKSDAVPKNCPLAGRPSHFGLSSIVCLDFSVFSLSAQNVAMDRQISAARQSVPIWDFTNTQSTEIRNEAYFLKSSLHV